MKKITVPDIIRMKADGKKIPVLTAYSLPVARLVDAAGIPMIIVGDSVGMVEAGYGTTIPVTIEEIIYHTRAVVRGAESALIVSDMPFGSYQTGETDAKRNAVRLLKEGGAGAVKVEGGVRTAGAVRAIAGMDIPVMGHVGLTPQSIHRMGGYKVQGKTPKEAEAIMEDARAIEEAGAFSIVIEGVPASLAKDITSALSIPTIGIGAGPHCDGQVLVVNDMLGIDKGVRKPRFVRQYADLESVILRAVREYVKDVEDGAYPAKEEGY
ncbi:MAG: 3-methyl-2-oxobutanoate hydroxymethyltransferase [Deltaproteobacteria bacterium]|nr:3-methyl-2-oxobutanoate hydroxymethyltransferase [Deltaproteobacteria bacterium]